MSFSLHHFIHTHEIDKEKQAKLHEKPFVRFIDKAVFIVAFVGPLTTAPQVFRIFQTHNAQDISITTWLLFMLVQGFWLLYGIAHRNKPIIISNCFWLFWQSLVIIGAIIY
ncbi:MAG: SemiSWEET family transporter [Patescibacteria group bacterium]